MLRFLSLLLFIDLLLPPPAFCRYRVDSWTTDNGLPQNSIMAMRQTRDGYLWFTTSAGMVRFDGVRFRVYDKTNTPQLASHAFSVFNLLEDRRGALWAGTWSGGVVRYENGAFTSYTTKDGLPSNSVVRLDEDSEGTVWIYTFGGLMKWQNGQLIRVAPQPGSSLNPYLTGRPEQIGADWHFFGFWRIVHSGWERFIQGRWSPFPIPKYLKRPEDLRVIGMGEDGQGGIWYSTRQRPSEKLHVREGQLSIAGPHWTNPMLSYLDRQSRIWLTLGNRVYLWKDGSLTPIEGISTRFGTRVLKDREGGFWVGTRWEGLHRVREESVTVYRHPGGDAFSNIHPILQDRDGQMWFSAGGLARFRNGRFENIFPSGRTAPTDHANILSALHQDSDGSLWVATWDGIYRLVDGSLKEDRTLNAQIKGRINAIQRDSAGRLWFGGERGVYSLDAAKLAHHSASEGLAGGIVRTIHLGRSGALWIGSDAGLSRFIDGRFSSWTTKDGLSSNVISSLYEDQSGVLWVGTYDGGLNRFSDGKFVRFTTSNGLSGNSVFQVLEDDHGFLWLSGHLGLQRVRKQELNEYADNRIDRVWSTHFGKDDGLINVECSSQGQPTGFKALDGTLWFPTRDGVAMVDPKRVPYNSTPPPVFIEECVLNGRQVPCQKGLVIGPDQGQHLELRYTAVSFVKPHQVSFRYQLTGLDTNWVDAGSRRTAIYSHVPPGDYVFRVIAANSDGVRNEAGASVRILVQPPFYRTWWFTALIACSVTGLVWLAWRRRVAQLERTQLAQQAFSHQLIASQESERKRIAAELHDSLGQRLIIIKNLALLYLQSPPAEVDVRDQMEEISSAASQAIGEVREISYKLRPYQLDRLGLTKAIEGVVKKVAAASSISITVSLDNIDGVFPKESEINVYRIVQESLSNIVRHAAATQASVTVQRTRSGVLMNISDNGRGFTAGAAHPESHQGGLGLSSISERAQLLGGTALIQSAPGKGTILTVSLELEENRNGQ